jgi:hypothetical protein
MISVTARIEAGKWVARSFLAIDANPSATYG